MLISISDMSTDQLNDLHLLSEIQYDINLIEDFIRKVPVDDSPHNRLVETRKRLDVLINSIKNYETEHTEDRIMDSYMGCD